VLETINVYYEISASRPVSIETPCGWGFDERSLDAAGLQYASRRVEELDGSLRKCVCTIPPSIPARITFEVDFENALVTVTLFNVDRLDRVALEFPSDAIVETVLEDLVRLMLGRDSAFLKRAPLARLRGRVAT
jgi:hypothetical protein